jgi:acyl-CoA synthetase (NDP forming)
MIDSRLGALIEPRSIAIVGATGKPGSLFARPIEYLSRSGYGGSVYPVNPKYPEIGGLPCYPDLHAIPSPVDLVLVLVPAAAVVDAVEQAGAVGAQAAIVFSSGFAETGPEGQDRQRRLVDVARQSGLRVVGPNCQGVIYAPTGVTATFTGSILDGLPPAGGLAYVGQSGAVGGCVMDLARDRGVGVGAWASVGNQSDVDVFEVASLLLERDDVRVLSMYVEALEDGAHLTAVAERAAQLDKPLVLLRSGRTDSGRRAAVSHTGGMLGPGEAFDALARRHGAVVVDEIDELVDVACSLLRYGRGHGPAIAIATASGGAGSIAADQMTLAGLDVPELSADLQQQLSKIVPDFGSVGNPVDATFQLFASTQATFADVGRALAESPAIDQLVMVMTAIGGEKAAEVAQDIVELADSVDKPVHYAYLVGHDQTRDARRALQLGRVTAYASLARVAQVANSLMVMPRLSTAPVEAPPDERFAGLEGPLLTEAAALSVLDAAHVPRPRSVLVQAADAAQAAVRAVGGRAVLKVQSPAILHKSDRGLVRLDVVEADAVAVATELLAAAEGEPVDGILVQEHVGPGVELLVGITRARTDLPALLTIGVGGVLTELLRDTVSECLPLTSDDIGDMLARLRASRLLDGFRGAPPADVPATIEAIRRVVAAAEMLGERLEELEVNPLIIHSAGEGAHAVDALIRVRAPVVSAR